ncbi:MAG: class I SAM-dependent methyltransferase [Alphaproteobacteria bacterium]|nr:class I SAM-dependent methyltransferase [Alphaproteobacteria bacterium]
MTTLLLLAACAKTAPPAEAPEPAPVAEAAPAGPFDALIASPDRQEDDRVMDPIRQPADWLAFFEIAEGQRVAELGAGGGYSTDLIARVVGPEGAVYSQNPPEWDEWSIAPWDARVANHPLPNVVRVRRSFQDPLPEDATDLDAVLFILIYHDVATMDVDRAAMNAALYDALKPGGLLGVIDHHAVEGAGDTVADAIHRIEASTVRAELEAAGFEFVDEADFLAFPEDPRTEMAWARPQPRTDRFVFKLRKPTGG